MYLHEQGVIHRDIKGANILSTKEGAVKLADFGVATKRGSSESNIDDPAGSPYWMAPEIIEMNGATPKSDIWSVGCTIVELATGSPPYFELESMAALYRIVQNDSPPIPEGISPILKDFIMKCFQKEPFLRASADQLLKHRWLQTNTPLQKSIVSPSDRQQLQEVVEDYNKKLLEKKQELMNRPSPIDPKRKVKKEKKPKKIVVEEDDDSWDDIVVPVASKDVESDDDWANDFDDTPKPVLMQRPDEWSDAEEGIDFAIIDNMEPTNSDKSADDDNWDDLDFDVKDGGKDEPNLSEKLRQKMNKSWDTEEATIEDDPFDMFDEELFDEDYNFEETLLRDEIARITNNAIKAIEGLSAISNEETLLSKCEVLTHIFREHPNEMSNIIGRTGVIPFIEALQVNSSKVQLAALKIVNTIVEDAKIRESFCVMGGIPTALQYVSRKHPRPVRLESSVFLKKMISFGKKTMKLFMGARGLPVLIDLISLDEDYTQNKDLFLLGIDCIYGILTSNLKIRIPKNDYCRIFAKANILPCLARGLQLVSNDVENKQSYSEKVSEIFIIFSKGDQVVKEKFSEADVLKKLFHCLTDKCLDPPTYLKVLKCINSLAMSPSMIGQLQQAGTIKVFVGLMANREGELAMESLQQLFSAVYNMCRLDGTRQLAASKAGIIPHLQWVIRENHPLKQFALPLMFEMTRTKKTRGELWKHDGITFFMSLFVQQYPWQVQAVDSVSQWLLDEPRKVSIVIEQNVDKFIDVFVSAKDDALLQILEPFNKMISHSKTVNRAMGKSKFTQEVIDRLKHHNALVRVNLLKILKALFIFNSKPQKMIQAYNLKSVVRKLEKDEKVLVAEMARELSRLISKSLKKEDKKKTKNRH